MGGIGGRLGLDGCAIPVGGQDGVSPAREYMDCAWICRDMDGYEGYKFRRIMWRKEKPYAARGNSLFALISDIKIHAFG